MPIATLPPEHEKALLPLGAIVRYLKRRGILLDATVAGATSISDLISDTYANLRSGTTELFGSGDSSPELNAVRRFEQIIRLMEDLGILTEALVVLLQTVYGTSATTDLLYLVSSKLTDTSLDTTTQNSLGIEGNYAYAQTR